jgi:hypothetical protein
MKNKTRKFVSATLIAWSLFALEACNQQASTSSTTAAATPSVPTPVKPMKVTAPVVTPEDWKKALEASYRKDFAKDGKDGVEEFVACFEPNPNPKSKQKCGYIAFGKRDAFRKLRFYETGIPMMIGDGVSTYVSLEDNGNPVLFLAPYIFGDHWMFMNKMAIMVDGDVILEHDLNQKNCDREVLPGGVQERCDFIATDLEIENLRKIKAESKVLIRISGEKGYMTLSGRDTSDVKKKIIEVLHVYGTIQAAVRDKVPTTVSAAS